MIEFKQSLKKAINHPRFHHQWKPNMLFVEDGFNPEILENLKAKGHDIKKSDWAQSGILNSEK